MKHNMADNEFKVIVVKRLDLRKEMSSVKISTKRHKIKKTKTTLKH